MPGNKLLDALSPGCRDYIESQVFNKPIMTGEVLFDIGNPLRNLVFVHDGLVSMRIQIADNRYVEAVSFGVDGVVGAQYLLGVNRFPWRAVTVISGRASWLPIEAFVEAIERFPCLEPTVKGCISRVLARTTQGVICAAVHSAHQRISTWLHHAHDRVGGREFEITQSTLAEGLGLRQATVSAACNDLLSRGAIHYSRGQLRIVDAALLKSQCCECYDAVSMKSLMSKTAVPLPA